MTSSLGTGTKRGPELTSAARGSSPGDRLRSTTAGLRPWQRAAHEAWESAGRPRDWLVEATPGAGKTRFALHLVRRGLDYDPTLSVAIVCPTSHLRTQWQMAAHRAGIELATELDAGLGRGLRGAVLTYQQVLSHAERYRRSLGAGWVIPDECHHAGEGRSWADAMMHAFGDARHRLSLSGTAFRSDSCPIPFVRYDATGVSLADFRYGYREALADGVVRPVYFVAFGGDARWYKGGRLREAAFDVAVGREDASARLRTALDPVGGWMRHALYQAHRRLLRVRSEGHRDAGGLVICIDQEHARATAAVLRQVTGDVPALALSDDPRASEVIERFTVATNLWIVAVRQVSEGTDIPRLRVGVWATNASTELFFRQVVGRLVRVVPGVAHQDAFLYLPADPHVLAHARAIAEERCHQLTPDLREALDREPVEGCGESDFRALGSTATGPTIIVGSAELNEAELEQASARAAGWGLRSDDPLLLSVILRDAGGGTIGDDLPVERRRRALRLLLARRVRQFCSASGESHRDTYARLKRFVGRPVARMDEAGLVRHVQVVESWIERTELMCGSGAEGDRSGLESAERNLSIGQRRRT